MPDQVAEIKEKTDIISLIGEYVDLKKAGRNYKALCPFHSEKTPSFNVSPELQIFKCFGCSEAGDVFSFLQKYEGMDFYEALKFLADRTGVKLTSINVKDRGEKQELYEINRIATRFYQYLLLKHASGKQALLYLTKNRGLKLTTIKTFKLGYSPELKSAIKNFLVDKKKFNISDLKKAGILYSEPGRAVDRFAGRVLFPLFDHRDNVVGFAGRTLPSNKNAKMAKYINSPETPIYHKSSLLYGLNVTKADIKSKREVVVVEGELDLISSWQNGVKNAVALKGSAFTEDQARLLSRFSKKVILALDADIAGDSAARRGITIAENAGLEVRVAQLVGYKDPDEMVRKSPEEYKSALANAVGVWDFIIDSIFSKSDVKTGTGKARISQEVSPVLATIADSIVQAHYAELVATKLGVPISAVLEQVARVSKSKEPQKVKVETTPEDNKKSRRQLLEERLTSIACQYNSKILLDKEISSLIKTPLIKRIVGKYKHYMVNQTKFIPSEFVKKLPDELKDGFSDMFIKDVKGLADKEGEYKDSISSQRNGKINTSGTLNYKKELEVIKFELQILDVKTKLEQAAEKIREFEEKKQDGKLEREEKKFSRLTESLSKLKARVDTSTKSKIQEVNSIKY